MLGRVFRIYPVYLICLFLGLLACLFWTPFVMETALWKNTVYFEWNRAQTSSVCGAPVAHLFWHITLLNGLIPKTWLSNSTGILPPAWSITLEWQYYLIAPLLAFFTRSASGLLLITGFAWLGLQFGSHWRNPGLAFLPGQLPLFLIGIASYHFYEYFSAPSHRRSNILAVSITGIITLGILASWHTVALCTWALVLSSIMVEGNDIFSRSVFWLRTILLYRWTQRLGHISYPLYLVHWPIILGLLAAVLHFHPTISSHQAILILLSIGLPLILICAQILHVLVERPFMKYGKHIISGRQTSIPN
jgi:peptidoglycan/LPS O-acetylase OafA/YrhL